MTTLITTGGSPVTYQASGLIDGTQLPSGTGSVQLLPVDNSRLTRTVDYHSLYTGNPWVKAAVSLKARSFSRMPPKVFRREGDLDVRASTGRGAQLEARLRSPDPVRGISWQSFNKSLLTDYLVHGNALVIIESDFSGIRRLERVPWNKIEVSEASDGALTYREIEQQPLQLNGSTDVLNGRGTQTRRRSWTENQVIHIGLWEDPCSPVNTSVLASLKATIALYDAMCGQLISFYVAGARPSGHLEIPEIKSREVMEVTVEAIKSGWSGPANAGKVYVSPGKYTELGDATDQSGVIELIKLSREEIAAAFGVAPPLIGILDRAIFSNVAELRNFHLRDGLGPDIEMVAGAMTTQISEKRPNYRGVTIEYEAAAALKPDIESVAATLSDQLRIRTPNELRTVFNLPKLTDDPAADQIWSPNSGSADTGSPNPGEPNTPGGGGENPIDGSDGPIEPEEDA